MTEPTRPAVQKPPGDQRKALEDAERRANAPQPENFSDEAIRDKQVEIPPPDSTDKPIEGLDP